MLNPEPYPYFHQERALRIIIRKIIRDLGGVPLDILAPRTARLTKPIRLVPIGPTEGGPISSSPSSLSTSFIVTS